MRADLVWGGIRRVGFIFGQRAEEEFNGVLPHSWACSSSTTASSSFFSCWLWTVSSSTLALRHLFSVSTFFSWDSRRRTSSSR